MWTKIVTVRVDKVFYDLYAKRNGIQGFGYAWGERTRVDDKSVRVKPVNPIYTSVDEAFSDLHAVATGKSERHAKAFDQRAAA